MPNAPNSVLKELLKPHMLKFEQNYQLEKLVLDDSQVTFFATYANVKKAKSALNEMIDEKYKTLMKVYEEHDTALVKFAKQFYSKLKQPGCTIEFVKVAVRSLSGYV